MRVICILVCTFSSILTFGQQANMEMFAGNKLYEKGQYKEAAAAYQKAFETKKNREAQYNLGNALYQQKDFEQATKKFEEVARNTKDTKLKSSSNHNIGNTFLEQKKWDEAIQYFKQSLKQNPNAQDTKYNLAYAQAMKKKQEQDQQKQQKKDQQDQQKDQNKDNKDQEKDNKDQQNDPKKDEQQGDKERPQPQPSKLSKEQAEQILNALNQEEKKLKEKKDKGKGTPIKLQKDW